MDKKQSNDYKKRKQRIVFLNAISIVLVIAAIIWGIRVFFHLDETAFTDDAQVQAYINPINTRVEGYITEVRFTEHQYVKKGDTLIVIDDRELKIQEKESETQLSDALANKKVMESGTDVAVNNVSVATANLDELRAKLGNMKKNYLRYQNLLKEDVVTQFQFDQIESELQSVKAKYRALLSQQKTGILKTKEIENKAEVAQATIENALTKRDMARLKLSYTIITAPYDGIVGRKMVEEGQLLKSGQPVVSIIRGDAKWVIANYPESKISKLRIGSRVDIRVDALPSKRFTGKVTAISGATGSQFSAIPVDNSTGNFVKVQQRIPVKIEFTPDNRQENLLYLRAGMNVEVRLIK